MTSEVAWCGMSGVSGIPNIAMAGFNSRPQCMAERIGTRQEQLAAICNPLPGATAYINRRPVNIPAAHEGFLLLDMLTARFPQIPLAEWEARCDAGRFVSEAGELRGKNHRVRGGERVLQIFPSAAEPPVATDILLLFEDESIIVVRKPAPLPMHPSGRFNRNTLHHILSLAYAPDVLRPVHRLDANTSGVVVMARTRDCCRRLQLQFLAGEVEKHYLVKIVGQPTADHFVATASISAAPGALGTHGVDSEDGRAARTEFKVLERLADGTTLLEARLVTGRTNQIRVHLWHLGMPVLGDPAYLAGGMLGDTQTLDTAAQPLHLHAWHLAFKHPLSGEPMAFEAPCPWARRPILLT